MGMKLEIREDGTGLITGYVNVVGRESRVLKDSSGDFVEIIQPKTFQRALERNSDVGLMFNHERDVRKMSLELTEDNIGLFARAEINDADIMAEARAGNLTGWSFGFYKNADEWSQRDDGMRIRKITDLDLVEVSILDVTPAYIATSIEMRGEDTRLREMRFASEDVELVDNYQPPAAGNASDEKDSKGIDELMQLKRKFEFILLAKG